MTDSKLPLIICICFLLAGAQTYTLTITASCGGTTYPTGAVTVQSRVEQPIYAYPDSGYRFYRWTTVESAGGMTLKGTPEGYVSITSNTTLRADFLLLEHTHRSETVGRNKIIIQRLFS